MKKYILLPIFAFFLLGCDNNDDVASATDGFTYNNSFYETPNAYIEQDEEDNNNSGYPDNYVFFFTDGRMFDNDNNVNNSTGDYLFSLNTTKLVLLKVLDSDNPSLVNGPLQPNTTYIVSSIEDTVIIHDGQIDALSPNFSNNGIDFGMANENVGTYHTPGAVGPTVTINNLNLDANNPQNSTIDISYSMMNTDGEIITGQYQGTFGIIQD